MRLPLLLVAFGIPLLLVGAYFYFDPPPEIRVTPAEIRTEAPLAKRLSVMSMVGNSTEMPAPPIARAAALTTRASSPSAEQEDLFPFHYLGRVVDGTEPTIILFGNGRVMKVKTTGPVDENYSVDVIGDQFVVLRHMRLNLSKTIELSAPVAAASTTPPRAEDYPQD